MQKFPGDPQAAFEAAFRKDDSPDERRQWLDALKSSAPQNALTVYLSAAEHFRAGRTDQALQVMERTALKLMDANSPYGGGQTVKDRLGQLAQQEAEIKDLAQQTEALQPRMSPEDWISYKDRWRNFGEVAAARWLITKHGQK